ncbi:spindle assembly abnormal protein 6 homolog [Ornithodoros turicata]|uniref:spindle assembly abnormal protein 6 homolog n=1 Tax=Ornithodoros turicata TaxID=34597 RepID=UPI003139D8A1
MKMILDSHYRRDTVSSANGSDEEIIFCRSVNVQVKDDSSSNHMRVSPLCLTIKRAGSSHAGRKELFIQLTDEADPFFVYSLTLTEDDFHVLKSQQGLLVDFLAFPQKFVDLLEMCIKDEHKDGPKFVMMFAAHGRLGCDPSFLDVVETNPFKHLVHLSLKLTPAPESFVRKHLTFNVRALKDEKQQLELSLRNCEADFHSRLKQYQDACADRERELERTRSLHSAQLESLRQQHERDLLAEQERIRKATAEQQFKGDLEHREQEQKLKKQIQALEAQVSLLDALNKDLQEKLSKSDQLNKELASKVSSLEATLNQCQETAQILTREKDYVQADRRDHERDVNSLRSRVGELERQLLEKDCAHRQRLEQLEECQQQKKKVEELLEQKQGQMARRETALKTLSDDVVKGNEIIKKLQGEIRNYHSKLRLRSEVITKQEEVLTEKENVLQKVNREVDDLRVTCKKMAEELSKVKDDLEQKQQKLEETQKQIKTNENVIQWLNKQLNVYQVQQGNKGSPNTLAATKPNPSPLGQSPTYGGMARNFAFPPSAALLNNQVAMTLGQAGARQTSPALTKPDEPLVDPRFLQPRNDAAPPQPIGARSVAPGSTAAPRPKPPAPSAYFQNVAKAKPS